MTSTRWSNERIFAEHKDIEANVLSMHKSGQFVALADRRMIYIIDVDCPSSIVHRTNRVSKWDVVASEWSPHQQHLLALAYNQTTAVYSFVGKNCSHCFILVCLHSIEIQPNLFSVLKHSY